MDSDRGRTPVFFFSANPEKVGLPVLVVLPLAGFFTVTAGRARSTVQTMHEPAPDPDRLWD